MPALTISTNQKTQILDPMADPSGATGPLSEALLFGVDIPGPTQIIPPFVSSAQWSTLTTPQQQSAIDAYRIIIASLISVMHFDRVGLGTASVPKVISFVKPDTTTGTMTFVGGLLVAST